MVYAFTGVQFVAPTERSEGSPVGGGGGDGAAKRRIDLRGTPDLAERRIQTDRSAALRLNTPLPSPQGEARASRGGGGFAAYPVNGY